MAKPKIQAVRGTRDFYPAEMAFRRWLYGKVSAVSRRFGYQEYEGPILEPLELYAAKSGEELVKEQAYTLQDKGGETLALRPELTPTLARMVAARSQQLPKPIRWFSYGPFWRYERPQKGRGREFLQWNVDCLGSGSIQCEAEAIAVASAFFKETGLSSSEIKIGVNSRRLMEQALAEAGVSAERKGDAFKLIDKREKLPAEKWRAYAAEIGLGAQSAAIESLLSDKDLWKRSEELTSLFSVLAALGAGDYAVFDPSVIRGFDYYTGIVFEARDASGEFRAILGGGRYDNLVADVGGAEPLSGVGFAMGDMVIELVLEKYGRKPALPASSARVLVTVFGAGSLPGAAALATRFRAAGVEASLYPDPAKLDKQLKYADSLGIPFAAIVGPDEAQAGKLALKDLAKKEQKVLSFDEAVGILRS